MLLKAVVLNSSECFDRYNFDYRRMISAAVALCGVACSELFAQTAASPAQIETAQTQSVASLTPAEKPTTGSIPVRASLQIEAASARYRLTDTTTLFLKGFDAEGTKSLQSAVSVPKGTHDDAFWSDLIAGALQVRHQDGDSGQTLWFNPIFDAGLVIEWKLDTEQWQPEAAWWVLGQDIRNDAAAKGETKTVAVTDPASVTLQNGETVFRIASAPDWRPPEPSEKGKKIVCERVTAARASLEKLQATKGGSTVYWAARGLLTLGQPSAAANGPKVKPVLTALGPDARERIRVVSATPTGTHAWVIAMQSPDSPSLAVFITTSNVNTAPIALLDMKLLRFNKQEDSHE
jgi:hypothetical protein